MSSHDLFAERPDAPRDEPLGEGARVLRGFALGCADELLRAVQAITATAPLRHLQTPGGRSMSVAMSNAGSLGWVSDRRGYRYQAHDPLSGHAWPAMPATWRGFAAGAAARAGFAGFTPDACLINRYRPGDRMGLHQDRDETDMAAPIVSVSLGLPATFLFGGANRGGGVMRVPLQHGDVVVWGGPARLNYHGVAPLKDGVHPCTGALRFNLTFRKAG